MSYSAIVIAMYVYTVLVRINLQVQTSNSIRLEQIAKTFNKDNQLYNLQWHLQFILDLLLTTFCELALTSSYFLSNGEPCQLFCDSICPSIQSRTFDMPDLKIVK